MNVTRIGGLGKSFSVKSSHCSHFFHIMVTSRPLRSINKEFENAVRIEIYARDADVEEYVQSRLKKDAKLSKMTKSDPGFRQFLEGAVVDRCKGMSVKAIRILLLNAMDMLILLRFLLAKLHMDTLAKKAKYNKKAVKLAASQLPSELDSTYDQALERINDQDEADSCLAKQVLSWISLTYEPLSMILLQQAKAFQRGDSTAEETALIDPDLLVAVCTGLVMVDTESEVVHLAHYTIQDYLHKHSHHFMPNARTTISSTCLHHLLAVELPFNFDELPLPPNGLCRRCTPGEKRNTYYKVRRAISSSENLFTMYAIRHSVHHLQMTRDPSQLDAIKTLWRRALCHHIRYPRNLRIRAMESLEVRDFQQIPLHRRGIDFKVPRPRAQAHRSQSQNSPLFRARMLTTHNADATTTWRRRRCARSAGPNAIAFRNDVGDLS